MRWRSGSAQCEWFWSIKASTTRSGRRLVRSQRRSAAQPRRCVAGYVGPRGARGSGPERRRRNKNASRRWSARYANCVRPTRSCARHRLILPRRSSTADRSDDFIHRRVRGRADLQSVADRPVDLLNACGARRSDPARALARVQRDALLCEQIRRVWEGNFRACGARLKILNCVPREFKNPLSLSS